MFSDDAVLDAAYFDTGMLASKLSLTVILSPGLMFNFTSPNLTYLSVVGTEVADFDVDGSKGFVELVLKMVM